MGSTQNHRHTALAKVSRDLVGAPRGECLYRDANKIARRIIINFLDAVVESFHLTLRRRDACQGGKRERRELPGRFLTKPFVFDHGRFDECDFHISFYREERKGKFASLRPLRSSRFNLVCSWTID